MDPGAGELKLLNNFHTKSLNLTLVFLQNWL
jgi:hypothetical protein